MIASVHVLSKELGKDFKAHYVLQQVHLRVTENLLPTHFCIFEEDLLLSASINFIDLGAAGHHFFFFLSLTR